MPKAAKSSLLRIGGTTRVSRPDVGLPVLLASRIAAVQNLLKVRLLKVLLADTSSGAALGVNVSAEAATSLKHARLSQH
jgi:hypothetical protein